MGTLITLGIDKMEIDWGKNNIFKNHSDLFQLEDKKEISYYYGNYDNDETIIKMKYGYAKKLDLIKHRLDLLGYSMKNIEEKYNQLLFELENHSISVKIPFKTFKESGLVKKD